MQKQLRSRSACVARSLLVIVTFLITPLVSVAIPSTPLLAAPPAQGATSGTVIAVYETDVLPLEGDVDLQYTLTFFEDGTVELFSDISDGNSFLEYGEYEEAPDGSLTVTLLGIDGEPVEYADPLVIIFIEAEDGALEGIDFDADLFGADELIFYPVEIAETGELDDSDVDDTGEEDTEVDDVEEDLEGTDLDDAEDGDLEALTGAYVSAVLPDFNGGSDQFLTFVLHPDGTLIFTTYYLNGSVPILEVGDWSLIDGDIVLLNATGTFEEAYDEPVAVPFEWDGNTLTTSGITFYRIPSLAEMEESESPLFPAPDDELDDIVGYYESDLLPAASGPGQQYRLTLYADNSFVLESDYLDDLVTEVGSYEVDAETGDVSLTVTGTTAGDYEKDVFLDFEMDEDGSLVFLDPDQALFGEDGLILFPVDLIEDAEADEGLDSLPIDEEDGEVRVFSTTDLPAESDISKIDFYFLEDFSLIMLTTYNDGTLNYELGTWAYEDGDDFIDVSITEGESEEYDPPIDLVFIIMDDGSLIAEDLDADFFGVETLELVAEDILFQ
jgi:hypothetical protein